MSMPPVIWPQLVLGAANFSPTSMPAARSEPWLAGTLKPATLLPEPSVTPSRPVAGSRRK